MPIAVKQRLTSASTAEATRRPSMKRGPMKKLVMPMLLAFVTLTGVASRRRTR